MMHVGFKGGSRRPHESSPTTSLGSKVQEGFGDTWSTGRAAQPVVSFEDVLILFLTHWLNWHNEDISRTGADIIEGMNRYAETGDLGPLMEYIPKDLRDDLGDVDLDVVAGRVIADANRLLARKLDDRSHLLNVVLEIVKALSETAKKVIDSIGKG